MARRTAMLTVLVALLAAVPAEAIMGGRPASRPYPFMVSLQEGGDHLCGASVVRPDWILTAAHCVEGTTEAQLAAFTAVIGRTNLSRPDGDVHEIDRYVVHPAYASDASGGHDIALVHLATPTTAPPIRIAGPAERATWTAGAPARVIGWGTSFFVVGPAPDDLYEVDVPIVDDGDCESSYTLSPFGFDRTTMVCAGEDTGLKDSCQGDSGGPLLAGDLAGEPVQVGTVSFGLGCGFPLYYGVYGRVADEALRTWIETTLPPVSPAPSPAPAPAAPAPAPASKTTPRARLSFRRTLGSARKLRRRRAITVRVRSTQPVSGVRGTLRRGRRVIARARSASAGRLVFRLRRSHIRAGRLRLTVEATDAHGRRARRSATVRLRR